MIRRTSRVLAASAFGLAGVSGASSAAAYVVADSHWNPASLPIPYNVNTASAPASLGAAGARTAADSGFGSWAAPTCTVWRAANQGDTTRGANTSDRLNTIVWVSGSWPAALGDVNTTIGVTTPVWQVGGYYIDADIQFNNVGFSWNMTGTGGGVDAQSIATHEEGHFLGLNHSASSSAVMFASYSGGLKRTLTSDDIGGVCALYPSGTTPPPDAGTTTPVGSTGSPCTSGADCSSGICVNDGTRSFCTVDCTNDCGCPNSYACYPTTMAGVNVCGPGANACATMPPQDSGTTSPAGLPFGSPCSSSSACSSRLCVRSAGSTTGFCTQACADDCSCPAAYACFPTSVMGTNVCGPGANSCVRAPDAGITMIGDSGSTPSANDAATGADTAGDADGGNGNRNGGCGCAVPGRGGSSSRASLATLLALGAAIDARRRRRARVR